MSIKLLVADDSITIQKVIGIIFGGEEYSLTVVDNGRSAIEKAREILPDVLLIDALMPGMTGYEVAEAVRATPALASKPILILTGSFEPFDEDKAKKCGADDFLAKPFESQQIVSKVKELAELGASRTHTAPAAQAEFAQVPPAAAGIFSETAVAEPAVGQQPEAPQTFAPSDIWDAFTTETESPAASITEPEPFAAVQPEAPLGFPAEPDVFAIVNEESDSQLVQPAAAAGLASQVTASQWIPVEEHTFEFQEESVSDVSDNATDGQSYPAPDYAFGDIAFEDEAPAQPSPVAAAVSATVAEVEAPSFTVTEPAFAPFEEPSPAFTAPMTAFEEPLQTSQQPAAPEFSMSEPLTVAEVPPPATTVPPALTEEQLKAAISAVSKEVIERIVWEVVPDLAETLIKEAIRKIKEGR